MRLSRLLPAALLPALALTSCIKDNEVDYTDWYKQNTQYVEQQRELKDDNGEPYYETLVPLWAPSTSILIHWHVKAEERFLPLANSIVDVKYEGRLIDGSVFDTSYHNMTPADSIYRSRPNQNILGMQTAMLYMAPGDSVTIVLPPNAAYGPVGSGTKIKPYSTLVFDLKMVDIARYDVSY